MKKTVKFWVQLAAITAVSLLAVKVYGQPNYDTTFYTFYISMIESYGGSVDMQGDTLQVTNLCSVPDALEQEVVKYANSRHEEAYYWNDTMWIVADLK